MDSNRQGGTPLMGNSQKKLVGLTILMTLLTVVIVFSAVIFLNNYSKVRLLNQFILELPKILQDREEELDSRKPVFEEDALARGELGVMIYKEESGLSAGEKLEKIRDIVSAESVSLTDENGKILETAGEAAAKEEFEESIGKLEPLKPVFDTYSMKPETGKDSNKKGGAGFVMIPVEDGSGQRLVFEFDCKSLEQVYNALSDWHSILERMLSGLDAFAFVRTGDNDPIMYSPEEHTEAEEEQLKNEASKIFDKSSRFIKFGGESSFSIVFLRREPFLGLLLPCPKYDAKVLFTMPVKDIFITGLFCAFAISGFIFLNLILFLLYVFRLGRKKHGKEGRKAAGRELCRRAGSGRLLLFVATGCFAAMLLLLESRATIAYIGMTKRVAFQYDVYWRENQRGMIRSSYSDIYKTRARAAAKLLMENDEYRTREGLKEIGDTVKADYLMLFDENGNELMAGNSYTGFSIAGPDANLSEEYKAMLLGYPSVVVGPEKDPYSGRQQIGAAILMTGDKGQPEGFLLAVFDAGAMNAELSKESLENTVNTFGVGKGYKAAVISNEDGRFIAHTDPDLIGLEAAYYITEEAFGTDYEGFTEYDGKTMYVSGVTDGEKSLLFMVPEHSDDKLTILSSLMIVLLLLAIVGLYCPKACSLSAMAIDEAAHRPAEREDKKPEDDNPLLVFLYGYVAFFTVFAVITFIAAFMTIWPAFTFVFGEVWSRGVHLFSIWYALFFVSVTLSVTLFIRMLLEGAESRADLRTRTILKLIDSFIAYAAGITLVLGVLYLFGVNTEALVASAGIVSIAIGMGSKDMVSDVVAGLFLAIEDSIHLGDEVTVGSWKGRVTDMGIRTTEITDENRNVKLINNSHISDVVNMSRQKTSCVLELALNCGGGREKMEERLEMAVEEALAKMPELYGSLKVEETGNITQKGCTVRFSYTCAEVVREDVTKRLQEFMEESFRQDA